MKTKYWSDLTEKESQSATDLAKPFNDEFHVNPEDDPNYGDLMADNRISDNSMSMFAKWKDADGFIFSIDDDLAGSTLETVHERDLAAFMAQCMRPKPRM
jgi:hypothetical protein